MSGVQIFEKKFAAAGADVGFYKGGCPIHLKRAPEVEPPQVF